MYFYFEEWEHYGTSGFKRFLSDNEKKFKDYLIKRFKTPQELNIALKEDRVVIINGEKLKPKIKKIKIIKDIEL